MRVGVVVIVVVVVVLAVVVIGIDVIVVGVSVMCCRHSCFNYRRRCGDLSFFGVFVAKIIVVTLLVTSVLLL